MAKKLGQTKDITFSWITEIDPELEQWRSLAEEWLTTVVRGKIRAIKGIGKFLNNYIHEHNLTKVPAEFLRKSYSTISFYDSCYSHRTSMENIVKEMKHVEAFLDWVLENYFSIEDDIGNKFVPIEYHNPIAAELPKQPRKSRLDESNKNTLPYLYIKKLRQMLVPTEAYHFKDLSWAIEALEGKNGGDWFVVDYSVIDKNDSDCVWRKRASTKYEKDKKKFPEFIYEMWSPVRAITLYIKLLLPLRTYQVRMLDSGESDTYRYIQPLRREPGYWIENTASIKQGTVKHPVRRGVFRKFFDPVTNVEMTGFYINTNKTADIDKEEYSKGYEVPWQYEEALYWLSKLRDWQEKYNPIDSLTSWTKLEKKQLGDIKDKKILQMMGESSFLFRDPTSQSNEEKSKPISDTTVYPLWHKLLSQLEKELQKPNDDNEVVQLKFIKNKHTTLYPLHSLRVSLITAYALEGGVPMPILSKCIAGHARLIMTLYYTKAGITYVSEKMNEAEKK
ncbi:integrase family protein [Turicibacter sanguinis]|uniref:gamma-mobile-trio integrase GmtZ n=1 Tax=Turicibacter sanguinis TaxID=154288 RepID=UPI0006805D5C|nr:integrase family protein [Turicibacter sanguinis]